MFLFRDRKGCYEEQSHTFPLPRIKMINSKVITARGEQHSYECLSQSLKGLNWRELALSGTAQGGAVGGQERSTQGLNFLPPSAKPLARSDYFQDGGGPGTRVPDLPGAFPGTSSGGQGWKRRVPVEHFPPEVSWCPTGVYKEGGAPIAWF